MKPRTLLVVLTLALPAALLVAIRLSHGAQMSTANVVMTRSFSPERMYKKNTTSQAIHTSSRTAAIARLTASRAA